MGTECLPSHFTICASSASCSALRLLKKYPCGRVHSVFKRCCNIELPNSRILTAAAAEFPRLSGVVSADEFTPECLRRGDAAILNENEIHFPGFSINVSSQKTEIYSCLRKPLGQLRNENVLDNLPAAWEVIEKNGAENGLGEIKSFLSVYRSEPDDTVSFLGRQGFSAITALMDGILNDKRDLLVRAAKGLIGLGVGLTPSGDDILGGMVSALYLTSSEERAAFFSEIVTENLVGGGCTTLVSENMLRFILSGEIPDAIFCAVESLSGNKRRDVVHAFEKLIAFGSSSGTEIAMGVCLGTDLAVKLSGNDKRK